MRRVEVHRVEGGNSMQRWWAVKNPLRVCLNFVVIYACRFLPFLGLKNTLYRAIGMRVGEGVSVGLMAMFDIVFPELIELEDNCLIGYNATILAHEYLVEEWRTGEVRVGKGVMIGANATVLPGVAIGDGATVGACALVNRDVRPGTMVGGVPIREIEVE